MVPQLSSSTEYDIQSFEQPFEPNYAKAAGMERVSRPPAQRPPGHPPSERSLMARQSDESWFLVMSLELIVSVCAAAAPESRDTGKEMVLGFGQKVQGTNESRQSVKKYSNEMI